MLDIDSKHLRYFVATADHGSLRKAAAVLKVHESAISRRIRDLEDRIGASLFLRRPDGVSLTLAGQRFLSRARHALDHIREGSHEVATIGRSEAGFIKVGLFSSLALGFLSDLFKSYDQKYPAVHIDFVEGEASDQVTALGENELDIAFVIGQADWPRCDTAKLWTEVLLAALPEFHPLAHKDELSWPELANETFIVRDTGPSRQIKDYIGRRIREHDAHANIEIQRVGRSNILNLVSLRRGITLVSESETAIRVPGVVYRPVHGESVPFYGIWHPQNNNPAFRTLLSLAKSMVRPAGVAGEPPR